MQIHELKKKFFDSYETIKRFYTFVDITVLFVFWVQWGRVTGCLMLTDGPPSALFSFLGLCLGSTFFRYIEVQIYLQRIGLWVLMNTQTSVAFSSSQEDLTFCTRWGFCPCSLAKHYVKWTLIGPGVSVRLLSLPCVGMCVCGSCTVLGMGQHWFITHRLMGNCRILQFSVITSKCVVDIYR